MSVNCYETLIFELLPKPAKTEKYQQKDEIKKTVAVNVATNNNNETK